MPENMSYFNNILISYPKPDARINPWLILVVVYILVCLFFIPSSIQGVPDDYQENPNVNSWLSKAKARELMRYYGTNAIMITEDRVYIKRESRWICVYQNPAILPERDNR